MCELCSGNNFVTYKQADVRVNGYATQQINFEKRAEVKWLCQINFQRVIRPFSCETVYSSRQLVPGT